MPKNKINICFVKNERNLRSKKKQKTDLNTNRCNSLSLTWNSWVKFCASLFLKYSQHQTVTVVKIMLHVHFLNILQIIFMSLNESTSQKVIYWNGGNIISILFIAGQYLKKNDRSIFIWQNNIWILTFFYMEVNSENILLNHNI